MYTSSECIITDVTLTSVSDRFHLHKEENHIEQVMMERQHLLDSQADWGLLKRLNDFLSPPPQLLGGIAHLGR